MRTNSELLDGSLWRGVCCFFVCISHTWCNIIKHRNIVCRIEMKCRLRCFGNTSPILCSSQSSSYWLFLWIGCKTNMIISSLVIYKLKFNSLNKCLLCAYCIPGTVSDSWDSSGNKTVKSFWSLGSFVQWKKNPSNISCKYTISAKFLLYIRKSNS